MRNKMCIVFLFLSSFICADGYTKIVPGKTPEDIFREYISQEYGNENIGRGNMTLVHIIDGTPHFFYFIDYKKDKTNYAVYKSSNQNGEENLFYKINIKHEKGTLSRWIDLNNDKEKQDDDIFYLWY